MAHIALKNEDIPGISGLLYNRPDTAAPLMHLAQTILRGPSTLSEGERELIAASVSNWNGCHFCFSSHGAAAAVLLNRDIDLLDDIREGLKETEVSGKIRALLVVAQKVQINGKEVTADDIARAKEEGATDDEIHDTVLVAAAFCMYNRYVDGLGTWSPKEKEAYRESGERLAKYGYGTRKS
ncbi:MAG: peroxidase-related enzyme [Ignavibacteriae bacterium]|nr:peroxidase-related enzyme [Ignavibacteriota bacterium]MCB9217617.1 peroxidase-related enzyme [Ignavibacteria bacterium]